MNHVHLPDGTRLPPIGLGTWRLGESAAKRAADVAAVRSAIEMGYRVVDTAEMYGDGGAEEVTGRAIAEALRDGAVARDDLFVVSKVYPHNATRRGMAAACQRSLARLGLDHLDLYLLHWPGSHPLRETVAGFEALQASGRIRHWGVSNFDTDALRVLHSVAGGERCAVNQVYYSLSARGVEFDLLPSQRQHGMPLMAYCPLDQGALAATQALHEVAARHRATPSQIALAWLMSQRGVMVIPKAAQRAHLQDNLAAAALTLQPDDLLAIDSRFPAPSRPVPLAMR